MIQVFREGDINVPKFVCDICQKPITDAGNAVAVYTNLPFTEDVTVSEVLHAHKGPCHNMAEQQVNGIPGWDELIEHCRYLLNNTKMSCRGLKLKK